MDKIAVTKYAVSIPTYSAPAAVLHFYATHIEILAACGTLFSDTECPLETICISFRNFIRVLS